MIIQFFFIYEVIILFYFLNQILGRAMIIHRDEDDLGVARGLFNEFRIEIGDNIPVSI